MRSTRAVRDVACSVTNVGGTTRDVDGACTRTPHRTRDIEKTFSYGGPNRTPRHELFVKRNTTRPGAASRIEQILRYE